MENYKYFAIYEWMISTLKLKGSELLVFAMIYSISNSCETCYASQNYIAEFLGISRVSVSKAIGNLCKANLISKTRSKNNTYQVTDKCKDFLHSNVKFFDMECKESLHNNRVYNRVDNNPSTYTSSYRRGNKTPLDTDWGYIY